MFEDLMVNIVRFVETIVYAMVALSMLYIAIQAVLLVVGVLRTASSGFVRLFVAAMTLVLIWGAVTFVLDTAIPSLNQKMHGIVVMSSETGKFAATILGDDMKAVGDGLLNSQPYNAVITIPAPAQELPPQPTPVPPPVQPTPTPHPTALPGQATAMPAAQATAQVQVTAQATWQLGDKTGGGMGND